MHPITEAALLLALSGTIVDRFDVVRLEQKARITAFDKAWLRLLAVLAQLFSIVLVGRWLGAMFAEWVSPIVS